jgi:transcriptional regulator GlxA family with amidase domain
MSARTLSADVLREIIRRNGFKVTSLAIQSGLGKRTLERRFTEQFGAAPKQWIIRERMNLARNLLEKGLSNKEVAGALDYSLESNFCRDFKRFYGDSPQKMARAATHPTPDTRRVLIL